MASGVPRPKQGVRLEATVFNKGYWSPVEISPSLEHCAESELSRPSWPLPLPSAKSKVNQFSRCERAAMAMKQPESLTEDSFREKRIKKREVRF